MRRRPSRPLSAEERGLWAEIARTVLPLPGRILVDEPAVPQAGGRDAKTAPGRVALASPAEPPRAPKPPPLVPLDRRAARALARGQTRADATLDLHGLTQVGAYSRLTGFLRQSQASGLSLVLVITGRGRDGDEGRGVLRRLVPLWLALPEMRALVTGFQEAGTRQGGSGALYVRLRRRRF